jgi:molybdopterin/thiamine biosynthesis adenylyltransferase
MDDASLLRYSRHILLDELGIEAQAAFAAAHVLVVGAGGLGSPAAMYLAASGIGHLTLIDDDLVDLTNLQRQILHCTESVGQSKVESGRAALLRLNPTIQVEALQRRADPEWLDSYLRSAAVGIAIPTEIGEPAAESTSQSSPVSAVLDCSDNFVTRHALNQACVKHRIPLISGAALRFDAQITTFDLRNAESPCYACIFPPEQPFEEQACSTMGVFAPLVGIIGAMQAAEALRLIAGIGETLCGRLMLLDALRMEWNSIRVARQPDCPVCGHAKGK